MLTLYLPYPPNSGGQIRSYNLIKNLSKKHEITLVSFIKKGEEKYASEMEKYCKEVLYFYRSDKPFTLRNVLQTGFSLYPFVVMRNLSKQGHDTLVKKLKKDNFDIIHVETFYLRPHVPQTKIPIVLVDQTIEFEVYRHYVNAFKNWLLKPLYYIDVFKLRYWETKFWREANRVVAVSDADKKVMQSLVPGLKVDIIPNAPGDDLAALFDPVSRLNFTTPVIFYQSNFLWMQNVEGAEVLASEVFPLIKKKIPNAVCRILGQNASSNAHSLVTKWAKNGVEVVEQDKSDITAVIDSYRRGNIFVAPLAGPGGTRLKILGAMSAGVPVVTTPIGIKGIDAKDGEEVLIGETSQDLAENVVKLIRDRELYKKIIINAKKLIKEKYSWETISKDLEKIYEETAAVNNHS